jgi:hypothetical protein
VKYQLTPLNTLVPSPYNPPSRENKTEILANNIKDNGLLVPIVVATDMTIIDGHRRHMALKFLAKADGKKESEIKIPIIKHNSDSHEMYDRMFIAANTDTMLINGHQYLWRYMKGASVPKYHLSRINWLIKALGKSYAHGMFRRILRDKHSALTYQMVMGIYCRYCSIKPHKAITSRKTQMRQLAYFLLNVETPYRVKSAIAHFIPVRVLKKCVRERKHIATKFATNSFS